MGQVNSAKHFGEAEADKKITRYYKTHGIKKGKGIKKSNGKKEIRKVKGLKKPII